MIRKISAAVFSFLCLLPLSVQCEEVEHECTSWMVFHDLTGNNTNILHKNRDSVARNVVLSMSEPGVKRKWIASGSKTGVNMGLNTSGLAGVMNSGEKCIHPSNDKTRKSTPAILKEIMSSCDTAAQAVERLKQFLKEKDYHHGVKGSIFFFMDPKEGYVCEMTAEVITVQPYNSGYAVRANIWQNPQMQRYSRNDVQSYLNSSARAYIAYSGLNQALDKYGKIGLFDIFDLSRHCKMPEKSSEKRSVCFKFTNATASLEIDRQYPDVLSSGYFTIGHPRHTIYVPVPVCAEKLHPAMGDLSWSAASWKRLDTLGVEAPVPEKWLKYEKESMDKYFNAKDKARKLLDSGKRAEAVTLLNKTAEEIWNGAAEILKLNKK